MAMQPDWIKNFILQKWNTRFTNLCNLAECLAHLVRVFGILEIFFLIFVNIMKFVIEYPPWKQYVPN